jgi:ribosomal protein S27E
VNLTETATVTQTTRAPADGRRIASPCCGDERTVYHFAWWAIPCRACDAAVIKYEWVVL